MEKASYEGVNVWKVPEAWIEDYAFRAHKDSSVGNIKATTQVPEYRGSQEASEPTSQPRALNLWLSTPHP